MSMLKGTLRFFREFAPALPLLRPVVGSIDPARENSGQRMHAHRWRFYVVDCH
jgi:hypothetical protein